MKLVTIHSDGACSGNPGPGGWAAVLEYAGQRREISGGEPATTNNRMELTGAIEALRALRERCNVAFYTDSEYVKGGITKGVALWKRQNWRTVAKTPVKNKDLWMALDELSAQHNMKWHWLKGHAGHTENERCDQLARVVIADLRKKHSPEQLSAFLKEFRAAQTAAEAVSSAQPALFA